MAEGIRVSPPSVDVFTMTAKQSRFNSDYPFLKLYKWGDASFTPSSGAGSVSISHSLGYAPSFIVFKRQGSIGNYSYFPLGAPNSLTGNAERHTSLFAYSTSTDLVIQAVPGWEDAVGDQHFRYYIMIDRAETFTGTGGGAGASVGFRVAKPLKSVFTDNPYDLVSSLEYKALQYHSVSKKTQALTLPEMFASMQSEDLTESTYVDFNHGLGYPPLFTAWFDRSDGVYRQLPYAETTNIGAASGFGATNFDLLDYEVSAMCDSTKIRVYFYRRSVWDTSAFAPSATWASQTINIKVVPFTENLSGSASP